MNGDREVKFEQVKLRNGGIKVHKKDIKEFMIVETGYDDTKYLVMKNCLVRNNKKYELEGFELKDFNEDLINISAKPYSISKVYKPVNLTSPFELNVEKIYDEHRPKMLWKRQPTPVSLQYLKSLDESIVEEYVMNLVYPCVCV